MKDTMIPILIICFNNHRYVDNTIKQIKKVNKDDLARITIVNNSSTNTDTIKYLESCGFPLLHKENNGPRINTWSNEAIYHSLPAQFIITDPDLEFNPELPTNYIEILSTLAEEYKCGKIGFALDLSDADKMYQGLCCFKKSIYEWEKQYWENPMGNLTYKLYKASLDTTFCLIDKRYLTNDYFDNDIRIAGCFTAKHIPWYRSNPLFNVYDNYSINGSQSIVSTTAKVIRDDIENTYEKVVINNTDYMWVNKLNSITFQPTTLFETIKIYLYSDRDVIDIGGGRVDVTVYMSRKARRVYVLNGGDMQKTILKDNCTNVFFVKEFPLLDEVSLIRFGSSVVPIIVG